MKWTTAVYVLLTLLLWPVAASAPASAASQCPTGPSDYESLLNRREAVTLADKPVRINPDGLCGFQIWYRNCIYLRQAGEQAILGPYCPQEAVYIPGAILMRDGISLPADVEYVWSAQQSFTAYLALTGPAGPNPGGDVAPAQQLALNIVGSKDWLAACAKKYKSFDPVTLMYTGASGAQHRCKLP